MSSTALKQCSAPSGLGGASCVFWSSASGQSPSDQGFSPFLTGPGPVLRTLHLPSAEAPFKLVEAERVSVLGHPGACGEQASATVSSLAGLLSGLRSQVVSDSTLTSCFSFTEGGALQAPQQFQQESPSWWGMCSPLNQLLWPGLGCVVGQAWGWAGR